MRLCCWARSSTSTRAIQSTELHASDSPRLLVSTDVGDLGPKCAACSTISSRRRPDRRHMVSGECLPLLDVFETERTIEIVLDVPGRHGRQRPHPDQVRASCSSSARRNAPSRSRGAGELSPRRARLRPLRARRARARGHRRVAGARAAQGRRAAHHPAEDPGAPRARDHRAGRDRHRRATPQA